MTEDVLAVVQPRQSVAGSKHSSYEHCFDVER